MIRVRTTSKGVHTVSDISAASEPQTQAANPLTEIPEKRNADLSKIKVEGRNTKLEKHERSYHNVLSIKLILYHVISYNFI